jgi:hypothetical protein
LPKTAAAEATLIPATEDFVLILSVREANVRRAAGSNGTRRIAGRRFGEPPMARAGRGNLEDVRLCGVVAR